MTKRLLFISGIGCIPATAGNRARILAQLDEAERLGYEVWFCGLGLDHVDENNLRERFGVRSHFLPYVLTRNMKPFPRRMVRIMQAILVRSGLKEPNIDYWFRHEWLTQLGQFAAQHTFATVMVEYVFFSKAFEAFPSATNKIIDTHDVFSKRRRLFQKIGVKDLWFCADSRNERRGLLRADTVIAIQDEEAKEFRHLLGGKKPVVTVGHWVTINPVWKGDLSRPVIGYLASDNNLNVTGLEWFVREVWPVVRQKCPHTLLRIGGAICQQLQPADGIELAGYVQNLSQYYASCYLIINPMRVGSGLKIKTIEALGYGQPLVTTSVGAAGLENGVNTAYLLADDAPSFASAVVKILSHKTLAETLGKTALSFAKAWNEQHKQAFAQVLNLP